MFHIMEDIRSFVADEFGFLIYLYGIIILAMVVDFITGIGKASKSQELNSTKGKDGLLKKVTILLILFLTFLVSFVLPNNTGYVANVAVWFGFLGFEFVSIIENCYQMGINVGPLERFIKVAKLDSREEKEEKKDDQ